MTNMEEFEGLKTTGYSSFEPTKPEDEFFHSVYISGQSRKNHLGITEETGKFQIRGVEYNKDEVNMIITHTKDILAKIVSKNKRDSIECFSFKDGAPPWFGSTKLEDGSPRPCPQTSQDRAVVPFCTPCRTQIIVAGILCSKEGKPILSEDKKATFVFIRGKGVKFNNVSTYLSELYKEDLSPIFEPATDASKEFEKQVVNQKRFVTTITKGQASSSHGMKDVFVLTKGKQLEKTEVISILKLSKQTLPKFNEKFDWSKNRASAAAEMKQDIQEMEGIVNLDISETNEQPEQKQAEQSKSTFNFEDIQF